MNSGRGPISLTFFVALTGSNRCEVLKFDFFFFFWKKGIYGKIEKLEAE